jgi:hypothetical protein
MSRIVIVILIYLRQKPIDCVDLLGFIAESNRIYLILFSYSVATKISRNGSK